MPAESQSPQHGTVEFSSADGTPHLRIGGDWTLAHYRALAAQLTSAQAQLTDQTSIDFSALGALDTAGARLLVELLGTERLRQLSADDSALAPERRTLLNTVAAAVEQCGGDTVERKTSVVADMLERTGIAMVLFWNQLISLLGFIGLTLETILAVTFKPRRWRLTSLAANLEKSALNAVPIVALLTFLVGAVVAFLGATVLADFGAGIYTVDLIAFSFLREFGALLTAILIAGRTASAFTAQIGSMRVNEEVDAIRVLGLNPIELLVLPRVYALLLALPILTFVAMISGIFGGMLVCIFTLDISPTMFFSILQDDVAPRHFYVGMAKAPIFAFLIAVIGCLEGFKVSGSAQSVGEHTTSAVVQSIFVVIVVDAIAALFCRQMGW